MFEYLCFRTLWTDSCCTKITNCLVSAFQQKFSTRPLLLSRFTNCECFSFWPGCFGFFAVFQVLTRKQSHTLSSAFRSAKSQTKSSAAFRHCGHFLINNPMDSVSFQLPTCQAPSRSFRDSDVCNLSGSEVELHIICCGLSFAFEPHKERVGGQTLIPFSQSFKHWLFWAWTQAQV